MMSNRIRSLSSSSALLALFLPLLLLVLAPTGRAEEFVDGFETARDEKDLPDGWHPVIDADHPLYNVARIFSPYPDVASEGAGSCSFRTEGKNTAVETDTFIQIIPARRYVFRVWIRTAGLKGDAAFASVHWLDKTGVSVLVSRTETVEGTSDWLMREIVFEAVPESVRFARIRLNLEGSDLRGQSWFDAVSFREELRLNVRADNHPGFLFMQGEEIPVDVDCPNLVPGRYTLTRQQTDVHGAAVREEVRETILIEADGRLHARFLATPPTTGFYRLRTTLLDDTDRELATHLQPLGVIPARIHDFGARDSFGVVVDPAAGSPDGAEKLIRALAPERIKILIWSRPSKRVAVEKQEELLRSVVGLYAGMGLELTGVIAGPPGGPVPDGKFDHAIIEGEEAALHFLEGPAPSWEPPLNRLFAQYRESIRGWQFGNELDPPYFGSDAGAADLFPRWRKRVEAFQHYPLVGVSAKLGGAEAFSAESPLQVEAMADDEAIPAGDLPEHLLPAPGRRRTLTLALPDIRQDGTDPEEAGKLGAFLKRLVFAKCATLDGIDVAPWTADGRGLVDRQGNVTAAFCAVEAYFAALRGATSLEAPFFSEGVTHRVFRSPDHRVLACWREQGKGVERFIGGDGAYTIDVGGAQHVLQDHLGVHELEIGTEPILLVIPDAALFDTQVSLDFQNPRIDSRSGTQVRSLHFTNAYPQDLHGVSLHFRIPSEWGETPEIRIPSIRAGETIEIPFSVNLPPGVTVGKKSIDIECAFGAGKERHLRVVRFLTVTSELDLKIHVVHDAARRRVRVRATITNQTAERLTARCFVACPDTRPVEATIPNLLPGEAKTLSFVVPYLPGVTVLPENASVRVMVRDGEGGRFVNAEAPVE